MKKLICYSIFLALILATYPSTSISAQDAAVVTQVCGKDGTNTIERKKPSCFPKTKADGTPAWTEAKARARHRKNYLKYAACDKETCIDQNYTGCDLIFFSFTKGGLEATENGWKSGTTISMSWTCRDCESTGPGIAAVPVGNDMVNTANPAASSDCVYPAGSASVEITPYEESPAHFLVEVDIEQSNSQVELQVISEETGDVVLFDAYQNINYSYLYLPVDLSAANPGAYQVDVIVNDEVIANCSITLN